MKKINLTITGKILITLSIIIIIFCTFTNFYFLELKQITKEEFINYFELKNCEVIQSIDESNKINIYSIHKNETCPYNIDYYIVKDKTLLTETFNEIISKVNKNKNITKNKWKNAMTYDQYYTKGNEYKSATKIKNSILYIEAENENTANKILKDLNYDYNFLINFYPIELIDLFIPFLIVISWWNLNKKLNRKGYIALIPIYNILCLSKDILGSKKYCLLLLLPIANAIFMLLLIIKLGKKFNKSTNYILLMIFIPIIFIPSLAFEKLSYQ